MSDPTETHLLERLASLEQQIERQQRRCEALAARLEGVLRTPFRVLDEHGSVVLEVVRNEAGVRLRLLDGEGRFLVTFTDIASGGSIAVHNRKGAEVVGLAAGHHGGNIGISTHTGQLAGWLNVTETGGHIVTRDLEGHITSRHP